MRKALDCRMLELTVQGIGAYVKCDDDAHNLWCFNVLNMNTAKGLSCAIFLYICKTFGLRGNLAHRHLDASQHMVDTDQSGNSFILVNSWNSKTFNSGLDHHRMQPQCRTLSSSMTLCL